MNYLAHVWLSGPDLHWQLGGLLGDFVKGPLPETLTDQLGQGWPQAVRDGVQLHRLLDARVDRLPAYRTCLDQLPASHRRLGSVALDVYFDHLLVQHWGRFSDQPLTDFSRRFYDFGLQQQARLPARAGRYLHHACASDLFRGYGEVAVYRQVLNGIAQRLRFDADLRGAGEAVLAQRDIIEPHFLELLPELQRWATQQRLQMQS